MSTVENKENQQPPSQPSQAETSPKKKRGRPLGSKNKPKSSVAGEKSEVTTTTKIAKNKKLSKTVQSPLTPAPQQPATSGTPHVSQQDPEDGTPARRARYSDEDDNSQTCSRTNALVVWNVPLTRRLLISMYLS
ncbi:hypothetical protein K435DRAFT_803564 [Dendrothele bispora CBS 962.96]|uniref:Uncharacterized protein n=1 Tax=Dendrothele bispora (strain CBS 962.96) TaxID=1314807 RepID=A0A4S8LIH7_DENBC|nr:hypothetical protein K435DRAFT_803564 [Dendrothele bispora CBS 962.96]